MSKTAGYFQYYNPTDRASHVKGADISHYQYPVNWATMYTQGNFVTLKAGGVTRNLFNARYIKVFVNGSTAGTSAVFNELKVYDSSGIERAGGKIVTSSVPPTVGTLPLFVDGNLATYVIVGDGLQWIKVDMGASYSIDHLMLQLYYADGRTFHSKKIQYSTDDTIYTTLFDSAISGEMPEKNGGMLLSLYAGYAVDSQFNSTNVSAARAAGMKVGAYFFKSPNYHDPSYGYHMAVADAQADATQFYNYIVTATGSSSDMGDTFPILDFENSLGNIYPATTNDGAYNYIQAFVNEFKLLSGRQIMLYTAYYTLDNLTTTGNQLIHSTKGGIYQVCPLWLAATDTGSYPSYSYTAFGGYPTQLWIDWQYASDGDAQGATWGVSTTDIDLNILEGTIATISPPSQPQNLTGTPGNAQASLQWNPVTDSDLQSYNIYQNGVLLINLAKTAQTYVVPGLTNGVSYTFTISAIDLWEEGPQSASVVVTPSSGTTFILDTFAPENGRVIRENGYTINKGDVLNDLDTKLGEVQTNPTANTVLDRLKQIEINTSSGGSNFTALNSTNVNASKADLDTIVTNTATYTSTNSTNVNSIKSDLDTLNLLIGALSSPGAGSANYQLADLLTRLGAAVASPTSNTVLDRLKTIGGNTYGINNDTTAIKHFKTQSSIVASFVPSTTTGSPTNITITNKDCEIWILSGAVYVDTVSPATVATGLQCTQGTVLPIYVTATASFIATAAAAVQILVYA